MKSERYPHINSMIVDYEIPSLVFGGQNCIHCNPGMTEPEKPPIPSISDWTSPILLRPLSSISVHCAAYQKWPGAQKQEETHRARCALQRLYPGRKHSVGILCVRSGVQCRTQLDCEGAGALRGFSGGALGWRPSLPARHQRHHQSLQGCADIKQPDIQRLASGSCLGEEGVKVCQGDMCTDLKGHLLEFWGS